MNTVTAISAHQLDLLHHTLGLTPTCRTSYRNHFVAGPGHHDQVDLEALEVAGLMKRAPTPAFCDATDVVFCCTEMGHDYALDNLPQPPKYSRYQEYLRSECSEGFAWWLGIDVPEFETYARHWSPFAFGKSIPEHWVRMRSSRAIGEFCKTQKEAKASYKAALAAARRACRYTDSHEPGELPVPVGV